MKKAISHTDVLNFVESLPEKNDKFLEVDFEHRTVTVDGITHGGFTHMQLRVLKALATGNPVTRKTVSGMSGMALNKHKCVIAKMLRNLNAPLAIETIHGVGYRMKIK